MNGPIIQGPTPFAEDGAQFAWDSTSLKLAETCLYKYYLKLRVGWQPERKSAHLIFGGEYASALEGYHKALAEGIDREQAIRDIVHQALINTWEYPNCETCGGKGYATTTAVDYPDIGCPDCDGTGKASEGGSPWESEHHLKTRGNLIRSIVWYFEQFRDDPCTTIITSEGKAAVEHSFKLPVDNDVIFSGHLDRLVEYAGSVYVQDQKSTGTTISSRFFDGFSPDSQMSMYTFAGQAIFNVPVKGVMIDAVQVAVGFSRYERGFTFRSEDQLSEWYDTAMHTIGRAQQAVRENYFPQNPSSCGNYGGCEFRHICSRSPSVREQFLVGDFKRGPIWNPMQAR